MTQQAEKLPSLMCVTSRDPRWQPCSEDAAYIRQMFSDNLEDIINNESFTISGITCALVSVQHTGKCTIIVVECYAKQKCILDILRNVEQLSHLYSGTLQ